MEQLAPSLRGPAPAVAKVATPRIAVVGCGYWGKNLVRVFHALGALETVCDAHEGCREVARRMAPDVAVVADFDQVLHDPNVEGLVIATPAETHFRLGMKALDAGKHLFVEKPLALNYREGLALVRQAHARHLQLMVGHILEYHPAIVELTRRVQAGALGTLHYIYSNRLNLGKVRREENILWSFAPHDIAVILRLVGDLPLEVCATGGAYLQANIADVTITNLLFDRGVRAHIFVSWLHPFKEQKLIVVGSAGMAVFDDTSADRKLTVFNQGIDWIDGQPVPRKNEGEVIALAPLEPLQVEAEQFLHVIRSGQTPITDGQSALANLEVLQAAQRSLSLHGQPVPLGVTVPRAWEQL
jgi:predicted dehydrogenase